MLVILSVCGLMAELFVLALRGVYLNKMPATLSDESLKSRLVECKLVIDCYPFDRSLLALRKERMGRKILSHRKRF